MTYDAVGLIPRDVLFGNPTYAMPRVSPDGKWLAYLAPSEGVLNVWLAPIDDPEAARPVTADRGRGIRSYCFAQDDRTLCYLQDEDGDENWRLYLLDLDSGDAECVTPGAGVQASMLAHNQWHPTRMLVNLNADNPELFDVWELDLTNRKMTRVRENPGTMMGWTVDSDLRIRGAASMTADGGAVLYQLDQDSDELVPWKELGPADASSSGVLGYSRDGSRLYYTTSADANASRLVEVEVATGSERVVSQDPTSDIAGVELDPATLTPQAVVYEKERGVWHFLDEKFESAIHRLRESLAAAGAPDGELLVQRDERTDRIWAVSVQPSDGPVHFYLYDRRTEQLRSLFVHRPELLQYALAPMEPFRFTSRDGLTVHGYLTYPIGVERRDLPAVLNVHGGPWARDSWGYHPEAQWLANRGYVCVQVNFRGSTGYGKDFLNAGDKQWGAAMHTDLLDALDHLVAAGTVDPERVGIMGGSYGGYAALAGAAFTPDVFRCAVDLCGPSNLRTLLASVPPYWKPLKAMFTTKVGDEETEPELLDERSPLNRVQDIRIPVLVAQGANDPRVKQAEAEQIVAALREKGLPHEYLLFPDEGHGLARPENRMTYVRAVEGFLAEHLGGRSED